ncbi:MAG: phenylacetate--CoA ligase [Candidatus Margulisbacteria bacterium GWF2_35_9]|nr:MAG: phenylacetate--CoA ligase [Candidatus Margulisbacteria bacterium GWF2_35_9]
MFWEKEIETISSSDLKKLQLIKLHHTIEKAKKSDYYKKILKKTKISTLKDIESLPFTSKQDLRDHFPYGLLAEDLTESVRLHSSSGTTGNPTVVFHTKEDIELWADLVARCMYMTGVRKHDVFQNTMGYGLFTGGLGFHYGAEKLGMLTIPVGPGNSKRQIWFMQQFSTTAVHILPSYAIHLYSSFQELSLDPKKDTRLKTAFIGAEPHTNALRVQIENLYGIKAYNSYGLSEMCGPGVAFECPQQNGMHIWEDHFYVEIIDPKTGQILPDGEEGELVLTTLKRSAMPLIRYRTRDLTRIINEPCLCGRTHRRIERIKGRSDDMLIINGVNIFPMQIEQTVMQFPGVGNNYRIEILKENHMDRINVLIEVHEEIFNGTLSKLDQLKNQIIEALKSECGVTPKVKLVEPESLPINEGKAVRVFDMRRNEEE